MMFLTTFQIPHVGTTKGTVPGGPQTEGAPGSRATWNTTAGGRVAVANSYVSPQFIKNITLAFLCSTSFNVCEVVIHVFKLVGNKDKNQRFYGMD